MNDAVVPPWEELEPAPWPEDFEQGFDWLDATQAIRDESARGKMLIGGHFLGVLLGKAIRGFLVESTPDDFFNGMAAPFGTFSARIRGAAALGIVTADEVAILKAFNALRNECAHSVTPDFQKPKMAAALATLAEKGGVSRSSDPVFIIEFSLLRWMPVFLNRFEHTAGVRLQTREWPISRPG